MYSVEELKKQQEDIDFRLLNKNLIKQYYLLKFYEMLTTQYEQPIIFKIGVVENKAYNPQEKGLNLSHNYSKRDSKILNENIIWDDYVSNLFDDVFCYDFHDEETLIYFKQNPVISKDNFLNFVDFQKQECQLNPLFNHELLNENNKDHFITICDIRIPSILKSKEDFLSLNLEDFREKEKENVCNSFYMFIKAMVKEVNEGAEITFIKDEEQYYINNIIIKKNGKVKDFDLGHYDLDDLYYLPMFFDNKDIVNKNNLGEIIDGLSNNMRVESLKSVIFGDENCRNMLINIEKLIINMSFDNKEKVENKPRKRM